VKFNINRVTDRALSIFMAVIVAGIILGGTATVSYDSGKAIMQPRLESAQYLQAEADESEAVAIVQAAEYRQQVGDMAGEIKALEEDNAQLVAAARKPRPRPVAKVATAAPRRQSATPARHMTHGGAATVQALIRRVCAFRGLSARDTAAMLELAHRESTTGQNQKAYRKGRQCVGLFQLDSHKGSYAQRCDNAWSTGAAITYCKKRYGSPSKALSAHNAKNWY